MQRVWPVATAGRLGAYAYDPATRTFAMVATSTSAGKRGARQTETVISIPPTVHGAVHVSGAAVLDTVVTRPDGSRLGYVATTLRGGAGASQPYGVTVGAPSAALTARVANEATSPPQPISEPTARAMAQSALTAAANSTTASLRSTAQLVQGLATIVLGPNDPNG
jgi:hypothetical protein